MNTGELSVCAHASEAIAIVCPSFGKQCGIARYSNYVTKALESEGYLVRKYVTVRAVYNDMETYGFRKILVQHEYGLFDDINPYLSAGETTSDIVVLGLLLKNNYPQTLMFVIVHSYVTHELVHRVANQQLIKAGVIPVVLNAAGAFSEAIQHLEHGVPNHGSQSVVVPDDEARPITRLKIGTFGFLKGNRGIDDLLNIVHISNAKLVAVLACDDPYTRAEFQRKLEERRIVADISYDFLEEEDVLHYIQQADCFVSLQSEIAHWGTTGSVRFLMQLGKPIFVYPHRQFYDLIDGVKFITKESITRELERIANIPAYRAELSSHVRAFAEDNRIAGAYSRLFAPAKNARGDFKHRIARGLGEPSIIQTASVYALAWLPERSLPSYLARLGLGEFAGLFKGADSPHARLDAISRLLQQFQSRTPDGQIVHFSLSHSISFNHLAGLEYLPLVMINDGADFVRAVLALLYRRDVAEGDFNAFCAFDTHEQKRLFLDIIDYSLLDRASVEQEMLTREEYLAASERLALAQDGTLSHHPYFVDDASPVMCGWELLGLGRAEFKLKLASIGMDENVIPDGQQHNGIQALMTAMSASNVPVHWGDPIPRLIQHSRRHYWITEFLYTFPEFFGVQVATSFFKRAPYATEYQKAVEAAHAGIQARIDLVKDALETANRFDEIYLHGLEQDPAVWKRFAMMKSSFYGDQDGVGLAESNFLLVLRVLADRRIGQVR